MKTRTTAPSRLALAATLLAGLALTGCGDYLRGDILGCGRDCEGPQDRLPPGAIHIRPERAEVAVGQTVRVTAELSGPIVHFSSADWYHQDSKVVRVRALACSEAADNGRTCAAEVTGLAAGTSQVSLSANLSRTVFDPLYGRTVITVTEP